VIFPFHYFSPEVPLKFKGIPLIISGTSVIKSINEVHLNLTGTVFEITGNHLNFSRKGTSQNLTEIMFGITRNHFKNTIRNGEIIE
jgi:hypothetical protein